jgi:hypothetical protein
MEVLTVRIKFATLISRRDVQLGQITTPSDLKFIPISFLVLPTNLIISFT